MDTIRAQQMRFVDDKGRERIFIGVNAVDKSAYMPGEQTFPYLSAPVLRQFAANGWNLIRLGFTWGKIEPQPGQYNEPYMDSVAQILDLCEQNEIYVFLDMHQDLFSPQTNGDGAPAWATLTDGRRVHPTRLVWAEGYFWGRACHRAFDHFWSNTPVQGRGLQDRFADCWAHLARRLGGKAAVIGFDVFNEPFPGTAGGACFRQIVSGAAKSFLRGRYVQRGQLLRDLLSDDRAEKALGQITFPLLREATAGADRRIARFDKTVYSPFLQKVSDAIRGTGTDKLLFLENGYYSNLGVPCAVQPVRRNGLRDAQQAFAPHAYDFMVDTPAYRYASDERVGGMFGAHLRTQQRLQMPVVVGEWGGFGEEGDDAWLRHITYLLSLFDRNRWSSAYWQYTDGFFSSALMRVLVRPYPQAVAGTIEAYGYDAGKKEFTMTFSQRETGESVLSTPFPVRQLTVDGAAYAFRTDGARTVIQTPPGEHTLHISF